MLKEHQLYPQSKLFKRTETTAMNLKIDKHVSLLRPHQFQKRTLLLATSSKLENHIERDYVRSLWGPKREKNEGAVRRKI